MIVFNLTCGNDHSFEGWFASSADFERQHEATQLNCPLCGSTSVNKGLQAPYLNTGSTPQATAGVQAASAPAAARTTPHVNAGGDQAQYMKVGAELKRMIEHMIASTEDVGNAFPEEARKIHYQEAPERNIRGHASADEVDELREEGIEVVAVPVPRHLVDKPH